MEQSIRCSENKEKKETTQKRQIEKKKQKGKGEKEMRDKILKVSYIMAWIGAIWFMLSLEASMWNIIPSLLCIAYVYAFGEANNGNWIISPH